MHTDQAPERAEVVLARAATLTLAATDKRIDRVALAVDLADDLVAEHERRHSRTRVAAVAVQVGATDRGELDVEHDFVEAWFGIREVFVYESFLAVPHERFHRSTLVICRGISAA